MWKPGKATRPFSAQIPQNNRSRSLENVQMRHSQGAGQPAWEAGRLTAELHLFLLASTSVPRDSPQLGQTQATASALPPLQPPSPVDHTDLPQYIASPSPQLQQASPEDEWGSLQTRKQL